MAVDEPKSTPSGTITAARPPGFRTSSAARVVVAAHGSWDTGGIERSLLYIEDYVSNLRLVENMMRVRPSYKISGAEQGWLGILVPEQYGGQGLGFAEMRVVAEGLGGALDMKRSTPVAGGFQILGVEED